MKKKTIAIILTAAFIMSACSSIDYSLENELSNEASSLNEESDKGSSLDNASNEDRSIDEASNEDSSDNEEHTANEEKPNEKISDDIEISFSDSQLDYSDIDEESRQLYRDFLEGKITAVFKDSESDTTESISIKDYLIPGSSYSFEDIKEVYLKEKDYAEFENATCSYLDCGLDGDYEFLVTCHYSMNYTVIYILKNIDDKLYICFIGDISEHKWNSICENGYYNYTWNIDGTNHWGNSYYIDADGNCHYLYSEGFGGCSRSYGDDTLIISLPDDIYAEFDEIGRIEYSEYSFSEIHSDPHYMFDLILYDTDGEEIKMDSDSKDLYNRIEALYEACGYTFVSNEEANEALRNARLEVGLTDEIYETEVGYYDY